MFPWLLGEDVLFLDDSSERHRAFIDVSTRYRWNVTKAYFAAAAIDLLEDRARGRRPYAAVFLDHDLDERDQMCSPGGGAHAATGMAVVDYLVEHADEFRQHGLMPRQIVVHSHNPPAAAEMTRRLIDSQYTVNAIQFYLLIERLKS